MSKKNEYAVPDPLNGPSLVQQELERQREEDEKKRAEAAAAAAAGRTDVPLFTGGTASVPTGLATDPSTALAVSDHVAKSKTVGLGEGLGAPVTKGRFDHLFGASPEAAVAQKDARGSALQAMFDERRKTAEKARTDNVALARYNALGNLITTLVQPIGWGAAGTTGAYQPYDNRAYLDAYSRAVKAADDVRNIGTQEAEYNYKIADEDYRRALAQEAEERKNQFSLNKMQEEYDRKAAAAQTKYEQDMAKEKAKADYRMALAEFNATHKITGRSGNGSRYTADERRKNELLKGYLEYATGQEKILRQPMTYEEWLKDKGLSISDSSSGGGDTRPLADI